MSLTTPLRPNRCEVESAPPIPEEPVADPEEEAAAEKEMHLAFWLLKHLCREDGWYVPI